VEALRSARQTSSPSLARPTSAPALPHRRAMPNARLIDRRSITNQVEICPYLSSSFHGSYHFRLRIIVARSMFAWKEKRTCRETPVARYSKPNRGGNTGPCQQPTRLPPAPRSRSQTIANVWPMMEVRQAVLTRTHGGLRRRCDKWQISVCGSHSHFEPDGQAPGLPQRAAH